MRIGITKREEYIEEEKPVRWCLNCKQERVELHLEVQYANKLSVCINPDCFLYTDITKLTTWVR